MMYASIFVVSLLARIAHGQICLTSTSEGLSSPPEYGWTENDDGIFAAELWLKDYTYTRSDGNTNFTTRAYSVSSTAVPTIPGPTLRMQRDKTYSLNLTNDLTLPSIGLPDHTNIHTHGLHVSGQDGADHVGHTLDIGDSEEHVYHIPCNHAGGLHWYHAHKHGSTAPQVGGGAHGAIIMEEDATKEGLPDWLATWSEDELVIVLSLVELAFMSGLFPTTPQNDMFPDPDARFTFSTGGGANDDNFFLLNGEYLPTVCMERGQWRRLRFVSAAMHVHIYFEFRPIDGADTCEIKLLAKDGIWLADAPRDINGANAGVWLAPGNRADILLHCTGNAQIIRDVAGGRSPAPNQLMGTIEVIDSGEGLSAPVLSGTFENLIRPSYVIETRDSEGFSGTVNPATVTVSPNNINGVTFDWATQTATFTIEEGIVQEWTIQNNPGVHPLHLHIYPMQMHTVVAGPPDIPTDWFVVGDYCDVYWGQGTVRFFPTLIGGMVVFHCHFLDHEDDGAMAFLTTTGGCGKDWDTDNGAVDSCEYYATGGVYYGECGNAAIPTNSPTKNPTDTTLSPTDHPIAYPSNSPTADPIPSPTFSPTDGPTMPTQSPSAYPTVKPFDAPSRNPTFSPTPGPTDNPSNAPTLYPTFSPTPGPTDNPSNVPTLYPTFSPIARPTKIPSDAPTFNPTFSPTARPTENPTNAPTATPTNPTASPTSKPTIDDCDCQSSSGGKNNKVCRAISTTPECNALLTSNDCYCLGAEPNPPTPEPVGDPPTNGLCFNCSGKNKWNKCESYGETECNAVDDTDCKWSADGINTCA